MTDPIIKDTTGSLLATTNAVIDQADIGDVFEEYWPFMAMGIVILILCVSLIILYCCYRSLVKRYGSYHPLRDEESQQNYTCAVSQTEDKDSSTPESIIASLRDEVRESKEQNSKLVNEVRDLNDQNSRVVKEVSELKDKNAKLVNDVGAQLAKEIAKDETKTEDINRKWRPSTIKEAFVNLSFQTASALKNQLQKQINKKDKLSVAFVDRVFCAIYLISEEDFQKKFDEISREIMDLSGETTNLAIPDAETKPAVLPPPAVSELIDDIKKYMQKQLRDPRPNCDTVSNIARLALESVTKEMEKEEQDIHEISNRFNEVIEPHSGDWGSYVADVHILAGYMAIQRPPMTFTTPDVGSAPDENMCRMLPSQGGDSDDLIVSYYLEPTLMHGENVMEKGRVRGTPRSGFTQEKQADELLVDI